MRSTAKGNLLKNALLEEAFDFYHEDPYDFHSEAEIEKAFIFDRTNDPEWEVNHGRAFDEDNSFSKLGDFWPLQEHRRHHHHFV